MYALAAITLQTRQQFGMMGERRLTGRDLFDPIEPSDFYGAAIPLGQVGFQRGFLFGSHHGRGFDEVDRLDRFCNRWERPEGLSGTKESKQGSVQSRKNGKSIRGTNSKDIGH